jgi:hypothetical protein
LAAITAHPLLTFEPSRYRRIASDPALLARLRWPRAAAWAEGNVTDRERDTVLRLAVARGVETSSPAHAQLEEWLRARPSNELFDAAAAAIKVGLSVLTPAERLDRITRIVEACEEVAAASGGLSRLLGLGAISGEEESVLDAIAARLRTE